MAYDLDVLNAEVALLFMELERSYGTADYEDWEKIADLQRRTVDLKRELSNLRNSKIIAEIEMEARDVEASTKSITQLLAKGQEMAETLTKVTEVLGKLEKFAITAASLAAKIAV